MSRLNFTLQAKAPDSRARATTFKTLHNEVQTPVFMPVGTHACVRGQRIETLAATGFPLLLANTYHLMLRPGPEVFKHMGGIHRFMNWPSSVLTDSGGYQIFSLPNSRRITEDGAEFKSYVDGRTHLLNPERSIEVQKAIGSDIMMVLDQCIPSTSPREEVADAVRLTYAWAKRSLAARGDSPQSLFGIVQGACVPDLRRQSAAQITSLPFDGFAIGGLAVGETRDEHQDTTELAAELLPEDRPRYLMGVGTPIDLLEAVHRGVDMFDCIMPTALSRHGLAFTSRGRFDVRRGVYRFSEDRLDPACRCNVCESYSRAYIHHLCKVEESVGWSLLAAHNLNFYHQLMTDIRASILAGTFKALYDEKRQLIGQSELDHPVTHPKRSRSRQHARQLGSYEVHEGGTGHFSVKHVPSGEVMHSVNAPGDEARALYVEQSRLVDRLREKDLVVWDVGLGAAINAMAAVAAVEAGKAPHELRLVSFENDLDSLRLALHHPSLFTHLWHPGPATLLEKGSWQSKQASLRWELLEGDFLEKIDRAPQPDLVFFDPFSFKTDRGLWTPEAFRRLFDRIGSHPVEIFTYSSSTAVRAALLSAGFFVARGVGTGPKTETTIALTPSAHDGSRELLGGEWLSRWERSHTRIPAGIADDDRPRFEASVRAHGQFTPAP